MQRRLAALGVLSQERRGLWGEVRSTSLLYIQARAQSVVLVGVLLLSVFVYGLRDLPLASLNEGLYAECAREMVETGDWLTPRINTIVYWEKPPLLYWLVAACFRLLGCTEFAARLPSALAAAATCLLTFLFADRVYGRRLAWFAVGIMASSLYFATQAQMVMFDSLLMLFFAGALFAFYLALENPRYYLLCALSLGLAVMTKGFVALVLFLGVAVVYCLLTHTPSRFRVMALPSVLIFVVVVAPWHIYEAVTHLGFAWFYFVNEHVLRFLGKKVPADFHTGQWYDHFLRSILLMVPWGIFLPVALLDSIRRQRRELFLLLWFAVPLLFFSTSTSKANYYMIISSPAMAILLAILLERRRRGNWLPVSLGVLSGLGLVAAVVISHKGYTAAFEIMRRNLTVEILGFFSLALLAAAAIAYQGRRELAVGALAVLMICLKFDALHLAVPLGPYLSERAVASELSSCLTKLPSGLTVILDGRLENHSALLFYLPTHVRPLLLAEGRWGDLWYGSYFEDRERQFISRNKAWQLVRENKAVYCLESEHLPPGQLVLCRGGDMVVLGGPALLRQLCGIGRQECLSHRL